MQKSQLIVRALLIYSSSRQILRHPHQTALMQSITCRLTDTKGSHGFWKASNSVQGERGG